MELLLAVVAVLVFSGCVVVIVVRRVLHNVRRRLVVLRDRARLAAQACGLGPPAAAARLRREMERSLSGVRRALTAARAVDAPVGDVPSLLARLELAARAVDGELRVLMSQPDGSRMAAQLAGPRKRADAIAESAACLVDGLLDAASHDAAELTALHAACAIEAAALRAPRSAEQSVPS
jgi:hypothetical protein